MKTTFKSISFIEALPYLDAIRETVSLDDPQTLYAALGMYLDFCVKTGFLITNKTLYYCCKVSKDVISKWSRGVRKTHDPRYREFACKAREICAAAREQYGVEGVINPILVIWQQKFYDGFTDNPAPENEYNPLGDMPDVNELIKKYGDLTT